MAEVGKLVKRSKSAKLPPLDDTVLTSTGNPKNGKHHRTLHRKRDLLLEVKRLNPAGCTPAPQIFWDVEGTLKSTNVSGDTAGVNQQIVIVENGVNLSARRYNDLKVVNDRKTRELKAKLDEMEALKRDYEELERMKAAETPDAARIALLEKEAEEVLETIAKKQHQTRVLEHMLRRLNRNQLKFDAHLNGMEETLKSIQKEGAEVKLLRRDLDAGCAKAVVVLEETKNNLAVSRKDREVLMAQRKNELKTAHNLQEWLRKRNESKMQLAIVLSGDLTKEEEGFLKNQLKEKEEKTKRLQKQNEESQRKFLALEEAFNEIKQVTGASNLDIMIEKFANQKTNKKNLEKEVKDAEKKLNSAKKEYGKLEQYYQELKSSGLGNTEISKEASDQKEEHIQQYKNEIKVLAAGNERVHTVLIGLSQGAGGLMQRVQPYQALIESGGVFDLTSATTSIASALHDEASWYETLGVLSEAEQILAKMLELVSALGEVQTKPLSAFDDDEISVGSNTDMSIGTAAEAPLFANNVRIKSRKMLKEQVHLLLSSSLLLSLLLLLLL